MVVHDLLLKGHRLIGDEPRVGEVGRVGVVLRGEITAVTLKEAGVHWEEEDSTWTR